MQITNIIFKISIILISLSYILYNIYMHLFYLQLLAWLIDSVN